MKLTTIAAIDAALPELARRRTPGVARVRRVLARRPPGAPPTESLRELVARVDLARPELGLLIELDGQQHAGQPVYDACRETAVVAATRWLCRLAGVVEHARRRPLDVCLYLVPW